MFFIIVLSNHYSTEKIGNIISEQKQLVILQAELMKISLEKRNNSGKEVRQLWKRFCH